MIIEIIIVFLSLVGLMALHELGHFLLAKKFGILVEEFGIGYPPRIWGKKFGETIYSLNWLPFGAFVKILGEEQREGGKRSFSQRPIWQRIVVLLGGALSFWVIAFLILSVSLTFWSVPFSVNDSFSEKTFLNPRVQIISVAKDSPAQKSGLESGDLVLNLESKILNLESVATMQEFQDFVKENQGQEVQITLQRGSAEKVVLVTPRSNPPEGEGALGVGLARIVDIKYLWYEAPIQSAKIVAQQTITIPRMFVGIISQFFQGKKVSGVEMMGPVGMGQMMVRSIGQGIANFLSFLAMISIWLAIFNLFPIPALDGGRILFLIVEAIRRKPMKQELEQKIIGGFFMVLLGLMAFVTIKDILKIFGI